MERVNAEAFAAKPHTARYPQGTICARRDRQGRVRGATTCAWRISELSRAAANADVAASPMYGSERIWWCTLSLNRVGWGYPHVMLYLTSITIFETSLVDCDIQ